MRVADEDGRSYLLRQGTVWQFAHIDDSSVDSIIRSECLFAIFRVVTSYHGKHTCRFVVREVSLPHRKYDLDILRQELLYTVEVNPLEGSFELHGIMSGDLVLVKQ